MPWDAFFLYVFGQGEFFVGCEDAFGRFFACGFCCLCFSGRRFLFAGLRAARGDGAPRGFGGLGLVLFPFGVGFVEAVVSLALGAAVGVLVLGDDFAAEALQLAVVGFPLAAGGVEGVGVFAAGAGGAGAVGADFHYALADEEGAGL